MRKQTGFSLIELLIVVAIILVIAAIAIPNLLRSRIAANEASAVGSLRSINSAMITYVSTYPTLGYPYYLSNLGPGTSGPCLASPSNACLLDDVLGAASPGGGIDTPNPKSGYYFFAYTVYSTPIPVFYWSSADPISAKTGTRHFYSDASGAIRYNTTTSATSADAPL